MEYQIALSPDLGLRSSDFIAAWNEDAESRNVAEARLSTSASAHYDPTLAAAIDLLLAVGTGVASNVLYDLIKKVLVNPPRGKVVSVLPKEASTVSAEETT